VRESRESYPEPKQGKLGARAYKACKSNTIIKTHFIKVEPQTL